MDTRVASILDPRYITQWRARRRSRKIDEMRLPLTNVLVVTVWLTFSGEPRLLPSSTNSQNSKMTNANSITNVSYI